uniref:Uncharacterized protein n=1 Tax=viral metagenome TaxID=1070528 RepID=A0A6C0BEP5_9ZZZZ
MDMKLKIVIVVFVLIAVVYAIYFIINDFKKQNRTDKINKNIKEAFEEYDFRKHVLSQLDSYEIDKQTKSNIYENITDQIEKYKDMPFDQLDESIQELVKTSKDKLKSYISLEKRQKKENFMEKSNKNVKDEDVDDDEDMDDDDTNDTNDKGDVEKIKDKPLDNNDDIDDDIDEGFENNEIISHLTSAKDLISKVTERIMMKKTSPGVSPSPAPKSSLTKTQQKSPQKDIIEGFDNFSSNKGYAFI